MTLPRELIWLDAAGVGEMLGYEARIVRERIACRPGFPKPARIGGRGNPRWNACEVEKWFRCKRTLQLVRRNHGKSSTRAHTAWSNMLTRCRNSASPNYKWYGARGIKICRRWLNFANFYADMGDPPDGLSIDRIDNDGNYEPGNCRWATSAEQHANQRRRGWEGRLCS